MKQEDVKKIKTILDFEETDKDFEEALIELTKNNFVVLNLSANGTSIDITVKDSRPDHFMMACEAWTDDQLEDFANMV